MLVIHTQSVMLDVWFNGPDIYFPFSDYDFDMNDTYFYLLLFTRLTRLTLDLTGVEGSSVPTSAYEWANDCHIFLHDYWKPWPSNVVGTTPKYEILCRNVTILIMQSFFVKTKNKGRLRSGLILLLPLLCMHLTSRSVQQCTSYTLIFLEWGNTLFSVYPRVELLSCDPIYTYMYICVPSIMVA